MIEESKQRFRESFGRQCTVIASAPGRLEILGNHLDYNGGRVIGMAINRRITVAASARADNLIRLSTDRVTGIAEHALDKPYDQYRGPDWAAFPLAVVAAICDGTSDRPGHPRGLSGFDLSVTSKVPVGAGLSSSAAIELAVAVALNELFCLELSRDELITRAHLAETVFVGVPCGKFDQNVVGLAEKGSLIVLDHASGSQILFPIPEPVSFVVFPTHVAHRLRESPYAARKMTCSRALQTLQRCIPGTTHLAHYHHADLDAYGSNLEHTQFKRARHVIQEQHRVDSFIARLRTGDLESAGSCLSSSHDSSRDLFDNSSIELDFLVEMLKRQPGVLGSRLTGAGFGGAALAMVNDSGDLDKLSAVEKAYTARFGVDIQAWQTGTDEGARVDMPVNR